MFWRRKGISFFVTGLERSVGGIASANRNVRAALAELAEESGERLSVHILHEPYTNKIDTLAYGGWRSLMALNIIVALATKRLVVFDHVHLAAPLVAAVNLPRRLRAKTVIFAHGSESWKRVKPISVRAFRSADLVLANSHYTFTHMSETFNGFQGQVCPLGLPPQFPLTHSRPQRSTLRPVLVAADGNRRQLGPRAMLLVGRMEASEREKGHRELIAVLPKVCAKVPEAELVFVGGGSDAEEIGRIAATSPVASNIFLPGEVNDNVLKELYDAAYAYVMPSRQEGFGLVYLEAMNRALPCLACHDDGGADVVMDGVTGMLVHQPIDKVKLTEDIIALLSDPRRARAMGIAGWRRLHSEFTSEAHKQRVLHALCTLGL